MTKKKTKKKTVSATKKKLWTIFSKFIRERDKDKGCVTCGKWYEPKRMQAGHFISRAYNSTLFSEINVHSQCYACNIYRKGATDEYILKMEEMYGREAVDELLVQKHQFGS